MTSFAEQCGVHDAARQSALLHTARLIEASGVELVRFAWCDLHGMLRGKTLVASAAARAMMSGVGMVSTLLLKDSADRTAYKVFDADGALELPGFEFAGNVMLLADPASYRQLPWASKTGWVQCQAWHTNSDPVVFDTRRVLQAALARLAEAGYGLTCGLEVEFHLQNQGRFRQQPAGSDASRLAGLRTRGVHDSPRLSHAVRAMGRHGR